MGLLTALLVSGVLLIVTNALACSGRPGQATTVAGLFVLGGILSAVYIPLIVHAFLLWLAGLLVCGMRAEKRAFVLGSLAATCLAYTLLGLLAWSTIGDYPQIRDQYPFQSLSERLAYEARGRAKQSAVRDPSEAAQERLAEVEKKVEDRARLRAQSLELMHASSVRQFVESPGFGPLRMFNRPGPLHVRLLDEGPVALGSAASVQLVAEDTPAYVAPGTDAPVRSPGREQGEQLWRMHQTGLVEFLNPEGFGYVQNRKRVAGFQSHGFRRAAPFPHGDGSSLWRIEKLELVGLLRHETPVVYVSEYLPRMDQLGKARTRPLDTFERASLAALQRGEDLMKAHTPDGLRVLGTIRAGQPCLSCHDAERGALLGAFSYKLRRAQGSP